MVKFVGSVVLSLLPIYANVLSAQAQSCIPPNTLCANLPVVGHVIGDCSSQDITLPSMPACCHVRSMANKPICPSTNPTTTQNCRSIELDGPACVAAGQCRGMYLSMNITSNPSRERCCDICTCYGDPHCESFTGVIDTWVLCDARTPQGTSDKCPITEKQCLKEKDHNGNQCVWLNPPSGTKWQLGLMGSQCVFNSGIGPLPEMLMYKADDFEMRLVLGERGIITQAKMKTNGAFFSMTSQSCFDDYFNLSRDPRAIPWRNDKGVADPSPSWLPRTWQYKLLPGGDIMWYVFGLKSNIGLRIRCTRTAVRVNGVTRFGPPRLNIEEIIEPKKVADRTGADGFCKTNKIDKLKSTTKNSEIVMSKNCAEGVQDDAQIESLLCSKTALAAGSAACRAEWCKATRKDWQDCVVEINKLGWARTWCASKTLPSMDPDLCVNGECAQCVSNVGDFGWPYTIEYWSNRGGTGVDEECFTVDTLPTDAIACQKAITIQYEESPGVWKSFKAIPEGAKLCGGSLVFNSNQHDVLFRYKIRVQQCDLRPDCLSDSCSSQSGFTASFAFKTEDDLQEDLVDLVESGDLVCNPELYGSDTKGCLQNTPEMCPCPSPTPT